MAALIRCCLRLTNDEINNMSEDDFVQTYCQVKYYLEVVNQVQFS